MMGECVKTGLAMITAHAAVSHTTKRKMRIGKMHDRVVNTAAAELDVLNNLLVVLGLVGKDIERQWLWARIQYS